MTTHADTKENAVKVLVSEAGLKYEGEIWGISDPGNIPGVWLIILEGSTIARQSDWRAFIVYINEQMFEEVNVLKAIEEYGGPDMKQRYQGNSFDLPLKEEY